MRGEHWFRRFASEGPCNLIEYCLFALLVPFSWCVGLLALRAFGARVDYLVPNRFEYGYGLSPEIVDLAAGSEPDLIVTVDNGIASLEGVARARELAAARQIDPSSIMRGNCSRAYRSLPA